MDILATIFDPQWNDADGVRRVSFLLNEDQDGWCASILKKSKDGHVTHLVSVSNKDLLQAFKDLIIKTNYFKG